MQRQFWDECNPALPFANFESVAVTNPAGEIEIPHYLNNEADVSIDNGWTKPLEHIDEISAVEYTVPVVSPNSFSHQISPNAAQLGAINHSDHMQNSMAFFTNKRSSPPPLLSYVSFEMPPQEQIMQAEEYELSIYGTRRLHHLDEVVIPSDYAYCNDTMHVSKNPPHLIQVPSVVSQSPTKEEKREIEASSFEYMQMMRFEYLAQMAAMGKMAFNIPPPLLPTPQLSGYIWPDSPQEKPTIIKRRGRQLACTCSNCQNGLNSKTLNEDGSVKRKRHNCHYPYCNKAYSKKAHLRDHLRWHTGEKPYICSWEDCSKRFIRSDELRRHVRTHTAEKRFVCPTCNKRFLRSDYLAKHQRTHVRKEEDQDDDIECCQDETTQDSRSSSPNSVSEVNEEQDGCPSSVCSN